MIKMKEFTEEESKVIFEAAKAGIKFWDENYPEFDKLMIYAMLVQLVSTYLDHKGFNPDQFYQSVVMNMETGKKHS